MNNHLAGALIGEMWAMDPNKLKGLVATIAEGSQIAGFVAGASIRSNPSDGIQGSASGAIARIPITGVIMKHVPEFFAFLGIEATGAVQTGELIKAALADESVEEIELLIDSPGGSIAGVQPLADLVHEAGQIKPVRAVVSDMAASAAYWIASQANEIEANESAMVGSVGVYRVMNDTSAALEAHGVKVHLISSGEFKGAGTPGTKITDPIIAREQRLIDEAANLFKSAIARGRRMSDEQVDAIATGETWFANDAKELNLIDSLSGVGLPEEVLVETAPIAPIEGNDQMTEEKEPVVEAPVADVPAIDAEVMKKEIEELQAALAAKTEELQAKAAEDEASKAALAAVIEGQKNSLIQAGRDSGRIVPAMIEQVEAFAGFCGDDVQKLEDFIAALPVQVRPVAESEQPATTERANLNDDDLKIAKLLGIDPQEFAAKSDWAAISANGEILK